MCAWQTLPQTLPPRAPPFYTPPRRSSRTINARSKVCVRTILFNACSFKVLVTHKQHITLHTCTPTQYRIAGNFRWCKFSHKMKIQLRIKFRNLNFRNRTPLYSTRVRTTVYDYTVQATPTCAENKISKVFISTHTAHFRIMRKFAPFENFQLYGSIIVRDIFQLYL